MSTRLILGCLLALLLAVVVRGTLAAPVVGSGPRPQATDPAFAPYPPPTPTPCPPPATPEPLWVEPVVSPTGMRYVLLTVYVGRGTQVSASSEGGRASVTGQFNATNRPAYLSVPLAPNQVNHLIVTGTINYLGNCTYTLATRFDRHGRTLNVTHSEYGPRHVPLVLNGR